jgi:hypothetical protein
VTIPREQVAEVWPSSRPAEDPILFGHARISPEGAFEARSLQTFELTYTCGRYGLDDSGAIRIVFRVANDTGPLQTTDASAANYVTARASNGAPLMLDFVSMGHTRPWFRGLTIRVMGGLMREGDEIGITFGDRSGGSPGMKLQTFCESVLEFRVLADCCATGHFTPIPDSPTVSVVPGPPAHWKALMPTHRHPGQPFYLGIKAEDLWGNPSDRIDRTVRLICEGKIEGLPDAITFGPGERSHRIDRLTATDGPVCVRVEDESGGLLCRSNLLVISDDLPSTWWGDLHGQSGESVGINTAEEYFTFARDMAFLDLTSHQANDFQVNNAFWTEINRLSEAFEEPGRMVTFPGYEWSGNTGVGGDRNVYFRDEGRQIRRSSHALLPDRSDIDTDSPTARDLFQDLEGEDCFVYAHVGGRYADISYAHDPKHEVAMEIHSAWGTFEWLLTDGFPLGHRSGVVCNSDGHKGRPGASYPGASTFGAYGGLTCFITDDFSRDGIMECVRRRHTYGTTGNRLHLDVRAHFNKDASLFPRDPNHFDIGLQSVREAMMGDIVQTTEAEVEISVEAASGTPIERIDLLLGAETHQTFHGHAPSERGHRVRVLWSGAEYRGRGRQTNWKGRLELDQARIERHRRINIWNPERLVEPDGDSALVFETITAGNFGGVDLWLDRMAGNLDISANLVEGQVSLANLESDVALDAGGLERRIRVFRLPDELNQREMSVRARIPVYALGDTPVWVRVTTEDGFQAWSSPIFLFRDG